MTRLGLAATTTLVASSPTYNRVSVCFQSVPLFSVRNWHGQEQPRYQQSLAAAHARTQQYHYRRTQQRMLQLKASSSEVTQEEEEEASDDGGRGET